MVDAIQAAGFEAAVQGASGGAASQPAASAYEVGQFAQAMNRAGGAEAASASKDVAAVGEVAQPNEGLKVLASAMDNLNGGASGLQDLAKMATESGGDLSPSQVIEMTMKSQQFMFQAQMTSSVANRTSDGIQQLFRQQS